MTETTLADVERALDRADDLETEAVSVLRTARHDLRDLGTNADVDEQRRQELEGDSSSGSARVTERDAYDGGLGAAMNPTEDDAP